MVIFGPWRRGALGAWMLAVAVGVLPASVHGELDEIQVHGLISQGYMRSTDNNYLADTSEGSFEFNEAIVNFSTQVSDNLRVGLQLLSRDLGTEGNNVVGLDWAYGDFRWRKNVGIRFGKLKSEIGLYNKGRDVDMLRTCIMMPQSVYEETTRDFAHSYNGFSVYGSPFVPRVGRLSYEVYAGTLPVRDPNSHFWVNNLRLVVKRLIEDRSLQLLLDADNLDISVDWLTVKYVTGGMLMWDAPVPGLRLGGNYMMGELDLSTRMSTGLGPIQVAVDLQIEQLQTLSAEYSRGDLLLAADLLRTTYDIDSYSQLVGPYRTEMKWEGYYGMVNYRLTDLLELGCYYTRFYPERTDKDGRRYFPDRIGEDGETLPTQRFLAWKEDIALSARFDMGDYWLMKLEAHHMDGAAQVITRENPDGLAKNWYLFLAKISCHF